MIATVMGMDSSDFKDIVLAIIGLVVLYYNRRVSVKTDAISEKADEAAKSRVIVAETLAKHTETVNEKLDTIHTLVNSEHGASLKLNKELTQQKADSSGDPVDKAAADLAAKIYDEYVANQANADFNSIPKGNV